MAQVIQVDGSTDTLTGSEPGGKLTLKQMQDAVGGLIELVVTNDPSVVVFANEEGLLIGMDLNPMATIICGRPLVGPVLICDTSEVD